MKILYGIQGTGNGHLARARALTPELNALGISTDFVFSGRKPGHYFDMDIFGNNYRCFKGMTFVTEQGRLQKSKTLLNNNLVEVVTDIINLDLSDYDLIINDFEPITAWASKIRKKPCIGISHQCAFDHNVPKASGGFFDKLLMRYFAPSKKRVGLHWHHFNQTILPPLIEKQQSLTVNKKKVLVYMGFEATDDVVSFISGFSDYEFHVYAKVDSYVDLGHVKIKPLSHSGFHKDLADANGVISNAGFELSSECLMTGKKLLIKPLINQYEQTCNALALQVMSRATIIETLDQNMLAEWLKIDSHQPIEYPDVAKRLAEWIFKGEYNNLDQLAESLWQEACLGMPLKNSFPTKITPELIY